MKEQLDFLLKVSQTLTVALCVWIASTLIDVQLKVSKLEVKLNEIERRINNLEQ